jgi:hypothetical protein
LGCRPHCGDSGPLGAYSERGGGASQSNLPGRYAWRRPVLTCDLARRIRHHRIQPLGRRSLHGVHSRGPERIHQAHRPSGTGALGGSQPTRPSSCDGQISSRPRASSKPPSSEAGRSHRCQRTVLPCWAERDPARPISLGELSVRSDVGGAHGAGRPNPPVPRATRQVALRRPQR